MKYVEPHSDDEEYGECLFEDLEYNEETRRQFWEYQRHTSHLTAGYPEAHEWNIFSTFEKLKGKKWTCSVLDNIQYGWYGHFYYFHFRSHGFDFTRKKGRRINMFQLLKNIFPSDWQQQPKYINLISNNFNLEMVSIFCLSWFFFKWINYIFNLTISLF